MFNCQECAQRYGLTMTYKRYPARCDICGQHDYCVRQEEADAESGMDMPLPAHNADRCREVGLQAG